jgi:hypothetical protein
MLNKNLVISGIKKTGLFYGIAIVLIIISSITMEQPRHSFGLNHILGILTLGIGLIWFVVDGFSFLYYPKLKMHLGSIMIHIMVIMSTIILFIFN